MRVLLEAILEKYPLPNHHARMHCECQVDVDPKQWLMLGILKF